jgi:hypothetical protein
MFLPVYLKAVFYGCFLLQDCLPLRKIIQGAGKEEKISVGKKAEKPEIQVNHHQRPDF